MKKTLSPFKSPNPSKKYTPIHDYTPIESAEALKKLIIENYPTSPELSIEKRAEEETSIFNELFADLKNESDPLLLKEGYTEHDPNHLYLFPLGTELIEKVLRGRKEFTFGGDRSKYSSSISSALFELTTNPGYGPSKQISYLLKSYGQGDSFEDEKNRRASEDLTELEIDEIVFPLKESTVREEELNQIYDLIISCDCRLTKRSPASNKNIEDISGAITDLSELRGQDFSLLKGEKDTIELELNELKIFKEGDSEEGTDIIFEQLSEELLKIKQELAEAKKSNELDKTFRQQELTDLANELGINFYPKKEFTAEDLFTGIGNLKDALEKLNPVAKDGLSEAGETTTDEEGKEKNTKRDKIIEELKKELEDLKLKIEKEKKEAADAVKVEKEKTEKSFKDSENAEKERKREVEKLKEELKDLKLKIEKEKKEAADAAKVEKEKTEKSFKDSENAEKERKREVEKLKEELKDLKLKIEQDKKAADDAAKVEKEKTEKAAEDAKIAKGKEEKEKAAEDAKGPMEKFYDALKKHLNENPGKKILSPSGVSLSDLRKMRIDPKSLGNSLSPTANSSTRGGG